MAANLISAALLLLLAPFVWAALKLKDYFLDASTRATVRAHRCAAALLVTEASPPASIQGPQSRRERKPRHRHLARTIHHNASSRSSGKTRA